MTAPTPASREFTLGLCQHACPPARGREANVERCCELIREAAGRGARIVLTQELFASDYFPQTEDEARFELAEPVPGPTTHRLGELARELGVEIVGSVFERRAAGVYHNTLVLIDAAGQLAGSYRKMHIPDDPGYYEKYYFTPGDAEDPWRVLETRSARLGMLVCWDQWFPEAARLTALRGAEVLVYPTAIGFVRGEDADEQQQQRDAWRIMHRSHAIANGVYVAAVNRVGTEGALSFWGSSFVADPSGAIIAEASESDDEVITVTVDPAKVEAARRGWPFLRDRRIDAYEGLTRRMVDDSE